MFLCLTGSASAVLFPEEKTGRVHADWPQAGYDAAKTGNTPDHGPAWDDVAFRLQLPGRLNVPGYGSGGHMVIVGRDLYVAHDGWDHIAGERSGLRGITKVNLDRATQEVFAQFEDLGPGGEHARAWQSYTLASDGKRLFAVTPYHVQSYDLTTGRLNHEYEHRWPVTTPGPNSGPSTQLPWYGICNPPTLREELILVSCTFSDQEQCCDPADASVVALETDDLGIRWEWARRTSPQPRHTERPDETVAPLVGFPWASDPVVIGNRVIVAVHESGGMNYRGIQPGTNVVTASWIMRVWGLDLASGSPMWSKFADESSFGVDAPQAGGAQYAKAAEFQWGIRPTGDENKACFNLNKQWACVRPADGFRLQPLQAPATPLFGQRDRVYATTLSGDGLFIATGEHHLRFNWEDNSLVWYQGLRPGGTHAFDGGERIVSGGKLYAVAANYPSPTVINLDGHGWVYAFEEQTGETEWRSELHSQFYPGPSSYVVDGPACFPCEQNATNGMFDIIIGGGVLVVAETLGNITVFGETGASPRPVSSYGTARPMEPFVVDLSATAAGLQGPATSFKVDWGDGAITDWEASSRLSHIYEDSGDYAARFMVRNDAGQSASALQAVRVAPRPGVAEQAFTQANQDLTFFILGLVITGFFAAVGLYRLRRRQRILKRELRIVDEVHARTAEKRADREKLLNERRVFAKVLLKNGDLDEPKYLVLERHIDTILRDSRTGLLDERFDYLPHGMMKRLEQMLADGHVTSWERDVFEEALRKDKILSDEQKASVRALIRDWFSSDSRAKAA